MKKVLEFFWENKDNFIATTLPESGVEKIKKFQRQERVKKGLNPNKPKKEITGIKMVDGFINSTIKDLVKPKVGSIVHCGLLMNQIEHSGIYIGHNKIVHLDGSGRIEIVSPKKFLDRLDGMNLATNIYVSCRNGKAVASKAAAERAKLKIGKIVNYSVYSNNCHMFVSGCLTGHFENKDNFFSSLEETVEKEIDMNEWRVWDLF
ncbi:lecithin retinol acyltransferase family protein [Acinetobacter wuhouensis]|nr:lecithin retinol acyltransferase family protein [Acinetobacter wuhouensis]